MGRVICTQEEFEDLLFDIIVEAKMVGIEIAESADNYADDGDMNEAIHKLKEKIIWES